MTQLTILIFLLTVLLASFPLSLVSAHGTHGPHPHNITYNPSKLDNTLWKRGTPEHSLVTRFFGPLGNVNYDTCSTSQISDLEQTMATVKTHLEAMPRAFGPGNAYVQAFWPADSLGEDWMAYAREYYARMASKLRIGSRNPDKFIVKCEKDPSGGAVAATIAEINTLIFYPSFFNDFKHVGDLPCEAGKKLGDYDAKGMFVHT